MQIEKGQVYSFIFSQMGRKSAAQAAFKLAKANGESDRSALKKSARAFIQRKVNVSATMLEGSHFTHVSKQLMGDIKTKSVQRVTTAMGVDPIRKRGTAQNQTRQVIIRTWPFKSIDHPGHASLSVKDSSPERSEPKHTFLSWWPTAEIDSTYNRLLIKMGLGELRKRKARVTNRYTDDKVQEISNRTQARLLAGAGDYSHWNWRCR